MIYLHGRVYINMKFRDRERVFIAESNLSQEIKKNIFCNKKSLVALQIFFFGLLVYKTLNRRSVQTFVEDFKKSKYRTVL